MPASTSVSRHLQEVENNLLYRFRTGTVCTDHRLIETNSLRFNYILFAQRLLDSTQDNYNEKYDPNRRVIGLDM